jgi:hypothetical protein
MQTEDLKNEERFVLMEEIEFSSTVPFLLRYIGRYNFTMGFFFLFLIAFLTLIIYGNFYFILYTDLGWNTILKFTSFGFIIGALPVIPVHELIHGITCRLLGAKKITYGVEWKHMMFYAAAHNFVMNRRQFTVVALSPFVIITVFFTVAALSSEGLKWLMWASAAFFHGTMCIGDFGLLSFFNENKGKEIYTYDDIIEKKTYFYRLKQ